MPCFKPLKAWYSKKVNESGRRSMVFNPDKALEPEDRLDLPCGQCTGCRLERSRQWAMRCLHESQLHENNCFITLTFNEDALQKRENQWSLDVTEFQKFMKRLRKQYVPTCPYDKKTKERKEWLEQHQIRYFHCGEYGENYGRPHYHACLFNFDFPDKELWRISNGSRLYRSKSLEQLWEYGYSSIGDVTFESAAYVARYIMKKVTGDAAEEHYQSINEQTGEVTKLKPEYTTMSRRPGIGSKWFEIYESDVYPKDFVTVRGKKMRPPKYYDKQVEKTRPYEFQIIKDARTEKARTSEQDTSPQRLQEREQALNLKIKQLKRNHDK